MYPDITTVHTAYKQNLAKLTEQATNDIRTNIIKEINDRMKYTSSVYLDVYRSVDELLYIKHDCRLRTGTLLPELRRQVVTTLFDELQAAGYNVEYCKNDATISIGWGERNGQ